MNQDGSVLDTSGVNLDESGNERSHSPMNQAERFLETSGANLDESGNEHSPNIEIEPTGLTPLSIPQTELLSPQVSDTPNQSRVKDVPESVLKPPKMNSIFLFSWKRNSIFQK